MSTGQELHHAELFPAINVKAFTVVGRGGRAPAVLTQIKVTKEREREIKGKYTLGRAKTIAKAILVDKRDKKSKSALEGKMHCCGLGHYRREDYRNEKLAHLVLFPVIGTLLR